LLPTTLLGSVSSLGSVASLGSGASLTSFTPLGSTASLASFTSLGRRTALDSLVARQAAEREQRLGVAVLVRVCARWACTLLPWRRIADEMKSSR
jgi:hypothetical protein